MFKNLLSSFVLVLLSTVSLLANVPDISLNYISKAACRVSAGPNRGSGVAIHMDEQYIYVLTNAHVLDNYNNVTVEFFKYGAKTNPLPVNINGKILNQDQDFAVLSVKRSYFGNSLPEIIPLAPKTYIIKPNTYCATAGNPFSRAIMAREGIILREEGSRIIFTPPPDNGQSGSGLFIRIDDKVYVVGIVTFRSGDYTMDAQGNPTTWGAAFNVKQLRLDLQQLTAYNNMQYVVSDQLYALASDGKYYPQNADGSVTAPAGLNIIQWNCPSGKCQPPQGEMVPLPRPKLQRSPATAAPPSTGAFQGLPEGFGEAQPPPTPSTIDPPKVESTPTPVQPETPLPNSPAIEPPKTETPIEIPLPEDLNQDNRYQTLKNEYDALVIEVAQLETKLAEKEKTIVELEKKIAEQVLPDLNLDMYKKDIEDLKKTIEDKNKEIEKYKLDINALQELSNNTPSELPPIVKPEVTPTAPTTTEPEKSTTTTTTNEETTLVDKIVGWKSLWMILAGVGGTLLFGKFKLFSAIPAAITALAAKKDVVEKAVEYSPEIVELLKLMKDKIDSDNSKMDGITDYVKSKLNDLENSNNVVNNITIDNTDNSSSGGPVDFKALYTGTAVNERIKQFFDLKKRDGDSIEKWAFFSLLYREAMQLLRRGQFEVDVVGNRVTLQGQKIAAEKIDNWVRDQFLKRTSMDKLDYNYLYHEAMIGFLYREAVKLLRTGYFPVLGAKETADAIENWVKREFLDRMGITL